MSKSVVLEKSIKFALRIVKLYRFLSDEKHEYVLSKQVLLSGTFIAKHVREATQAESRQVFASEMFTDEEGERDGIFVIDPSRRRISR